MTNALILIAITVVSFTLGMRIGLRRGIDIAMETAITETIHVLLSKAKTLGSEQQVKKVIEETFDLNKIEI